MILCPTVAGRRLPGGAAHPSATTFPYSSWGLLLQLLLLRLAIPASRRRLFLPSFRLPGCN